MFVPGLAELRQRRSAKWQAGPADVLPLTIAEMDTELAPAVRRALAGAVARSDTGYAFPDPAVGEALAQFAARRWGWAVDPGAVTAVTDVGVGIVQLLRALCRPGDAVAFSPPVYPPFFDWVAEAGARITEVPLARRPEGWRLDLDALEQAFAGHPAAYILCNPHNPVGRVHDPAELRQLAALAAAYRVTVISDEIHAPLVLPGAQFTPLLSVPGAAETSISVMSASKAWNLAGLKCAAVITASAAMRRVTGRFPPDARWRTGHLGAIATAAAYADAGGWLDSLLAALAARRDQLAAAVGATLPQLRWHPPEATFLAWLDCSAIGPGDAVAARLLQSARVAVEPGSRFGAAGRQHIRLNFGTHEDILAAALERIGAALRDSG